MVWIRVASERLDLGGAHITAISAGDSVRQLRRRTSPEDAFPFCEEGGPSPRRRRLVDFASMPTVLG